MQRLLITPMQEELEFFRQRLADLGLWVGEDVIGRLPVNRVPDLGLTLARGGTGKAQYAVHTQHLLDSESGWDLVICAGAAGALSDDLNPGDLVVATETIEHDYDNRFSQRPLPRFSGDSASLAGLRRLAPASRSFEVHFGIVASGDEDIVDRQRRESLFRATGASAVAWEGAGGARACAFSQVPYLEMRAITDTADSTAPEAFAANLETAMCNLASLCYDWIRQRE